ncbi:MAG: redoxin domain-containing protein [Candidatus Micrarchaeia archaeon]
MITLGNKIPEITLVDTDLNRISLKNEVKGPTLLAFFPGAFTGVCTKELCTFRDNISKFNSINAKVISISVDGPFSNKAFKEKNNLTFQVLSDYNREAVRLFGVELNNFAGLNGYTAAKRSVFLINKDGVVSYAWISDDPTVEPDYNVIMSEIQKLK